MKKLIILICLSAVTLAFSAGCGKKVTDISTRSGGPAVVESEASQSVVMDSFNSLLKSNPNEKDVIKFIKDKAPSLSKENASKLVLELENLQSKKIKDSYYPENKDKAVPIMSSEIERELQTDIKGQFSMDIIPGLKNTELKNALMDIEAKGYKIRAAEGMYEVIINYEAYKEFSNMVTADIKDYIDIKAVESNKPSAEDAALIITPDEVFNRAMASESFIKKYSDSERIAEVKKMYGLYAADFLYGQNNTPAFDYQTKLLNKSFKESYEKILLNSSDSNLVKTVQEYLPMLKKNNYKRTAEVENYLNSAVNKLKN